MMASRLSNLKFIFFTLLILTFTVTSFQNTYATHLSQDAKWQLVFLTHNPVCSNYDYQSVAKYTELTEKYLGLYEFPNSKYDSICTTPSKLMKTYQAPKDLDLLILVLDNDLGEEKLNFFKLGGIYAHSGLNKSHNHVIMFCDCSNFYYSDPVWTLTHELSHYVLYTLNYSSEIIERLIHRYDNTYDKCRESYTSECSSVVEKLRIDASAYSFSVMPTYKPAVGIQKLETEDGVIPTALIELNKFITKWWTEGKITEADYSNALGFLVSQEELDSIKEREIMFADGPLDDTGPTWHDILNYNGTNNKEKLFSIIPYDFKADIKRVYENEKELGLPQWFKQTVSWWLDNKITDEEFVTSVKYLRDMGLIQPH
jgi:hypothetical protein